MSAALKLEIYQKGEFIREVPFGQDEVWIGRDEDCVIRLEDRAISRKHGFLVQTAQGVSFEKKSKFGQVRFNGKDIEQADLKNGDRLELGPFEIRLKQESVSDSKLQIEHPVVTNTVPALPEIEIPTTAAQPESSIDFGHPEGVESMEAEPPVFTGAGAQASPDHTNAFDFAKVENDAATKVFNQNQSDMKAVLRFGDGDANVTVYEIKDDEVAIGRSQKCHIVLEDKRSSRKHSLIVRTGKKFVLKDLGSANGTLVNGERVNEHELQSGDRIQIGDTQFTFQFLQADYAEKKEQFMQVPHEESVFVDPPQPQMMQPMSDSLFQPNAQETGVPPPAQNFAAPQIEEKKSFIGKFLDRYRAMNTKQQVIWGVAILAGVYFMMDDDAPQKRAHLTMGPEKTVQQKKTDKKVGVSFESLTPDQQRYVETEYQLAFDFYKNREYDNSLLEISKVFSLVENYKNAREIEAFAREGKRKLEAQEEDRKKKETERQAQIKLQNLIEQAGLLMEKRRFSEAEALFADIELLQPENAQVGIWRKQMIDEKEKADKAALEGKRLAEINQAAWADFANAKLLAKDKKYWDALDRYDELVTRSVSDKKFIPQVKAETKRVEGVIANERDPVYAQAKQLESDGKLSEAYRSYQKANDIDPTFGPAIDGMNRIRGMVSGKVKAIYAEGVFAESYSDFDTAEKRYREVMDTVPNDDPYYIKSDSRLKKLLVFRRPAATVPEASQ